MKRKLRAEHLRHALNEGEAFAFEKRLRTIPAVQFGQFRLVVEHLQRAWRAGHVHEDDALGPRREMGQVGPSGSD